MRHRLDRIARHLASRKPKTDLTRFENEPLTTATPEELAAILAGTAGKTTDQLTDLELAGLAFPGYGVDIRFLTDAEVEDLIKTQEG